MTAPWERYAQAEEGPWKKYGAPEEPPTSAPRLVGQFAQNTNDAIAAAAGAPVDLVAAGLRQIGVPVQNPIGGSESIKKGIDYVATLPGRAGDAVSQGSFSPLTEERTSRFDPQNRAERIAAGTGQGVGAVLSTLLPAGAVANAARPGTLTQAIAGQLSTQPVTQLASGIAAGATTGATDDPLLGLAAGLAVPVGAAVGRGIISPTANRLTDAERQLVAVAQREGVPLTPSQQTGSTTLRSLEETMAKLPISNRPMQSAYTGQRNALNRAIMERTGMPAANAAPDTLRAARGAIGTTLDDLAARTVVNADTQFADDVTRVAQDYGRRLDTNVARVFESYMDDLAPLIQAARQPGANPQIAGPMYARIREDIGRDVRSAQNNPRLQQALRGIQQALDDAVERSTSGALRSEWQDARRQYAALMTVDRAMQGGTQADRAAGNIPLGSFSNAVKAGDRAGFSRAQGQYGELAKLADFLAPKIPDSGTATRAVTADLLTGGALFGGGAATGGFPAAVVAAGAPWAVSHAYNTPLVRAYLTNQAAGNTNLAGLYGAESVRRAIEAGRGEGEPTALARALLRANEKRAGAAR